MSEVIDLINNELSKNIDEIKLKRLNKKYIKLIKKKFPNCQKGFKIIWTKIEN